MLIVPLPLWWATWWWLPVFVGRPINFRIDSSSLFSAFARLRKPIP